MAIFWHALQNGGAGIRYLEFTGSLSYQYPAQWLEMLMWSHSVACLPVLHSLRVSRVVFDEDVAHTLGSYLLRTTTLQCIDINNVQINGTYDCTPSAVLRAAVQSSSLKSLTVRSFIILTKDIEAMAAALMRHPPSYASGTSALPPPPTSRMESLTFLGCPTYDLRLQRALAALIGGKDFTCPSPHVNSTLEMMAFNLYGTLPDVELLRLFNTVREVGASQRIHVSWCKPRPLHFARGGALCRIPSLFVDLDNCSAEDAAILLEPLASGTNVTSACIQCSTNVDDTVVQQLVNALANTKSVRTLSLQLDWPESSIVNVLRSLEQNCSVSVLEIDGTTFRKRAAKALARLVVQNRMLNKIFMNLEKENCECPQLRTVCRELKEAMPRNRFLTNVAVNLQDANHASDVVIKDALRRNRVFINEAVHFIKGSNEKKEALAFETLQYSRSVVTDLCTGAVECDEDRAKKQIDEARCRLALNYFIFTGVVKAKVVCRPHPKRKPRFDKLGKDMQARICSYLSLTDVIGI
ncbi:hypothetical protein V5799_019085 [Amblyomma americanum]|uniref:Ran gtpase-activating protein n=1 Tax=Amblyomma americanum TaxID=6943 RepID=A0AAQ4EYR0_AMBAM